MIRPENIIVGLGNVSVNVLQTSLETLYRNLHIFYTEERAPADTGMMAGIRAMYRNQNPRAGRNGRGGAAAAGAAAGAAAEIPYETICQQVNNDPDFICPCEKCDRIVRIPKAGCGGAAGNAPVYTAHPGLVCCADCNGFRPCPGCKVPVQKLPGCDKMECRCGAFFCWGCGEEYDSADGVYDHMEGYSCSAPTRWWGDMVE